MSTKSKIVTGYFGIALIYAIYLSNWGDNANRGFAYNAGSALVWPVTMLPGLGAVIGGVIMVLVVVLVLVFARGGRE